MRKVFKQTPEKAKELKQKSFSQEAYLEGFLLDNWHIFSLYETDDIVPLGRQIYFPHSNKKVDILLLNKMQDPEIIIVEIKNEEACKVSLDQLIGYLNNWREKPENILKHNEEVTAILKHYGIIENLKKVKGILVAPAFDESIEKEMISKSIQGIVVKRFSTDDSNENYIFIDYFPALKGKKVRAEITQEEFWRKYRHSHEKEVENILFEMRKSGLIIKYWQTTICIYVPDNEVNPVSWYVAGDKTFCIRHSIKAGDNSRIDLAKISAIVSATIQAKDQFVK